MDIAESESMFSGWQKLNDRILAMLVTPRSRLKSYGDRASYLTASINQVFLFIYSQIMCSPCLNEVLYSVMLRYVTLRQRFSLLKSSDNPREVKAMPLDVLCFKKIGFLTRLVGECM